MDPVHREVLDVNHGYLVEHLQASDIIRTLLNDEIVNNYDYEQMRRTEGQGQKAMNRLLLLTLRRRGKDAYAGLHKALRQVGQDDVCETLLDTELAIRDGLAADRAAWTKLVESNRQNGHHGGLTLSIPQDDHHDADLTAFLQSPVLTKPTSPALKSPGTPRQTSTHRQTPHPSAHRHSLPSPGLSQTPRNTQEEGEEGKEQKIQQLEQEISQLRQSHTQMENELRQQIANLEKNSQQNGKKSGGCSIM